MNHEWMREFVQLVKSGAQMKAYQKKLGLDRAGLKYHLGRLAEYEASLEPKKAEAPRAKPAEVEKKVEKVKSVLKKVRERLDKEVVKDEEGKTL